MLSKDIKFKNFKGKKINKTLKIFLKNLIDKKDRIYIAGHLGMVGSSIYSLMKKKALSPY